MKQDKKEMGSKINGDEEDTSSVINKERDGCQVVVQEQNINLEPSSPSGNNDLAIIKEETAATKSNNATDPSKWETNSDHSSPSILKNEQEDKLKSAYKAQMGEVREENERLKLLLVRIMTDYKSLQSQFSDILRQQEAKPKPNNDHCKSPDDDDHHHQPAAPHDDDQLVSLSLGRISSTAKDEPIKNDEIIMKETSSWSNIDHKDHDQDQGLNDGDQLALALGSLSETTKNSNSDNSFDHDHKEVQKELDGEDVEPSEMWPPSKVRKTARSRGTDHEDHDDSVSQTSPLKKARVSVRARCDAPTMNDGCQWRKYGQKIAKGNPCPRAYYRCTVSPTCPVRKQVQRCAEDMSILITTYEGTHNHPLPISATAMASTTSAAASMLQSHSTTSSSQPPLLLPSAILPGPISAATSSKTNFPPGLNFNTATATTTNLFQNSLIRSSPQHQFYFPNTSISTHNSHPTVTLDLTLPNHHYSSHDILGRGLSSNTRSYPSTCLSFSSSSSSSSSLEPIISNPYNGYLNYRNYPVGSNGNYNKQLFYQPYLNSSSSTTTNNNNQISTALTNQQSLTETIAAATKAITSNPNFKSALAAALTSFVGNGGSHGA